jgi:hypothetical protein
VWVLTYFWVKLYSQHSELLFLYLYRSAVGLNGGLYVPCWGVCVLLFEVYELVLGRVECRAMSFCLYDILIVYGCKSPVVVRYR